MKYVFMNNYRGFDETLVPINDVTFLVGENSTGKSSFLKLLHLFSLPQFWIAPEQAFHEEAEMGSFFDIVSVSSPDKRIFEVGIIAKDINRDDNRWIMALLTFKQHKGVPKLHKLIAVKSNRVIKIIFQPKKSKYKISFLPENISGSSDIKDFITHIRNHEDQDTKGFKYVPEQFPRDPAIPLQVALIESLANEEKDRRAFPFDRLFIELLDITWIAPIRTQPQRFYNGLKRRFSPEGEHTPFLLRTALRSKNRSDNFIEKLEHFGKESGLFESVTTHSFGSAPQAPFEILVKFSESDLNISNVGYGVSQALPLIVEFLSTSSSTGFAVQQPEVHLHPRAQAALGDLLYIMANEKSHTFMIETHSDFVIDRFRYALSKSEREIESQVVFFSRREGGNQVDIIPIDDKGQYTSNQPEEFRSFFINEDLKMLDL